MKLTLKALKDEETERLALVFIANIPEKGAALSEESHRDALAEAAYRAATIGVDLKGVIFENCGPNDNGDKPSDKVEAQWYSPDDFVAPEIEDSFNIFAVHQAIKDALKRKQNWGYFRGMGKKKGSWRLNVILPIEPLE